MKVPTPEPELLELLDELLELLDEVLELLEELLELLEPGPCTAVPPHAARALAALAMSR